jgi:hypothetical protein
MKRLLDDKPHSPQLVKRGLTIEATRLLRF